MSLTKYQYYIADVFTDVIFQGAQIAVFPYAEGLSSESMQCIAREMNLSETVFVFADDRSSNKRRLKVFSPLQEIDFSGHPIIAVGWVLASIKDVSTDESYTSLLLEQNLGTQSVTISHDNGKPSLVVFSMDVNASTDRFTPPDNELADILSIPESELATNELLPMLVSSGKNYLIVPIKNYTAVREAQFDIKAWNASSAPATLTQEILLITQPASSGSSNFHGRLLGADIGPSEDPPIGSSMPAFAAYLCQHTHIRLGTHTFNIDRGTLNTRRSELSIEMDNKEDKTVIRIGGPAVLVAEGQMAVPH